MTDLASALHWKYAGNPAVSQPPGIATMGQVITDWNPALGPEPTGQVLQDILDQYTVVLSWVTLRTKRDRLLIDSDFTQLPDSPRDKDAWAEHRQSLRDLPETYASDPDAVVWPEAPE